VGIQHSHPSSQTTHVIVGGGVWLGADRTEEGLMLSDRYINVRPLLAGPTGRKGEKGDKGDPGEGSVLAKCQSGEWGTAGLTVEFDLISFCLIGSANTVTLQLTVEQGTEVVIFRSSAEGTSGLKTEIPAGGAYNLGFSADAVANVEVLSNGNRYSCLIQGSIASGSGELSVIEVVS
jgi:hypothetical protein